MAMSPPVFPIITTVAIAEFLAPSEATLMAAQAVHKAPKEKAPIAIMKVAAYRIWVINKLVSLWPSGKLSSG